MDKNLIWAIALSTAFLAVWYKFFMPAPARQPAAVESRIPAAGDLKPATPLAEKAPPVATAAAVAPVRKVLESALARLEVDSRGAGVQHFRLKDKTLEAGEKDDDPGKISLDLVHHPNPLQNQLLPVERFPLTTYPPLNFTEVEGAPGTLTSAWRATLPTGIVLDKTYILQERASDDGEPSSFVRMTFSFRNPGKQPADVNDFRVGWTAGLGTVESEKKENDDVTRVLAYPGPGKEVQKLDSGSHANTYTWVGVDNRYYLVAFFPQAGSFASVEAQKNKTDPGSLLLRAPVLTLAPGEQKTLELEIYAGPKGYGHLKKLGMNLEHAVDFGYFGFLGKWALKALNALHRWTGNYGWAIILLTMALQVLVFPLTVKSYQSAAAMRKLQPKIQEIQKRYKSDPQRMNQEMMSLYRDAKTNPFGGCLPMVLQIPIFWAFFTMLRNAYELRGAPWAMWIRDLSQHDPYYVLPVVMGGGMVLQQKLSGSVADPTQAKIMMIMPVVFTFMFLKFPSGLVLYWLTNSILTISTQYWLMRREKSRA